MKTRLVTNWKENSNEYKRSHKLEGATTMKTRLVTNWKEGRP